MIARIVPRTLLCGFVLFLAGQLTADPVWADSASRSDELLFEHSHQAGVRLGGWANTGELPNPTVVQGNYEFLSDVGNGSLDIEAFFAYRFFPSLMTELSVGVVNRGDVELRINSIAGNQNYFGNLNVYPILAKIKFYPVGGLSSGFYPYLLAGGGIYHIRHDVFATGIGNTTGLFFQEKSATTADFVFGGGLDWPLSNMIGLELQVQYMPITFSDTFLQVSDWSALSITAGVKYLFTIKKKNNEHRRKHRRAG